ncbi:MAG: DUF4870 domain-containing protein [Alphaproteobacteria bacterium]
MPVKKTRPSSFWSMMCHLSSLLGFLIPGASLIAPLIIWGMKREQDSLINKNGQNVINFVLSFWVYSLVFFLIVGLFLLGISVFFDSGHSPNGIVPLFLGGGLFSLAYLVSYFLAHLALPIYGGIKALNAEVYRYPLTISFLKEPSANLTGGKSSAK